MIMTRATHTGTLKKCIVAFIDILGSSPILCSRDNREVERFITSMEALYAKVTDVFSTHHIKTFSDNILIFSDDCSEESALAIISSVAAPAGGIVVLNKAMIIPTWMTRT